MVTEAQTRRRRRRERVISPAPEVLETTVGIPMFDAALEPHARARATDPDTSHSAAEGLGDLSVRQRDVWRCLNDNGPSTDEELVGRYAEGVSVGLYIRQSASGLRTRRCELGDETPALVVDTGDRKPTTMGNRATVWRAVRP